MKNVFRIAKNALALLLAGLFGKLINALFAVVIIRHLSTSDYGAYSTILGFLAVGGLIADFGLSQVLVREIAQSKDKSSPLFSEALLIAIPLTVIVAGVIIFASIILGYSPSFYALLAIACLAILTNTLIGLAGAVLQAFERMGTLSLLNSVVLFLSVLVGVLWLVCGAGLREMIILLVATSVVNALALLTCVLRNLVALAIIPALQARTNLLGEAFPIAIFGICGVILQRFAILLLSRTAGMSDAGIFSAAVTVIDALTITITSVIGAVFPLMAIRWKESTSGMVRGYEQVLRFLVIVGMATAVGLFFLADPIVALLYGTRYVASASCLRILAWSFMLTALGGPVGMLLIVTKNRLRRYIPYALGVTALNVSLNLWLTPQYSYIAASWITVFTSLLLFGCKSLAVGNILPTQINWFSTIWRALVAAACMGLVLWWSYNLPLVALIAVGFVIYSVTLVGLGEFRGEYRAMQQYLLRKSKI